jgi:hypothetical protein
VGSAYGTAPRCQTAPFRRLRKRRPSRGTRRGWSERPCCAYARRRGGEGPGGADAPRPERQSRASKRRRLLSWEALVRLCRAAQVALAALAARCAGTGPSPMRLVAPDDRRRLEFVDDEPDGGLISQVNTGIAAIDSKWRSARRGRTTPQVDEARISGRLHRPDHGERPWTEPRPGHRVRQHHRVVSDGEAGTEQELRSWTATSAVPLVRNG